MEHHLSWIGFKAMWDHRDTEWSKSQTSKEEV